MHLQRNSKPLYVKLTGCAIILCIILLYTLDTGDLRRHLPAPLMRHFGPTWDWRKIRADKDATANGAYFVNEVGCRMPSFAVRTADAIKHWKKERAPVEACPAALTASNWTGHIWVAHNRSELLREFGIVDADTLNCTLVPIRRKTDWKNQMLESDAVRLTFGQVVRVRDNSLRVNCTYLNETQVQHTKLEYHYFVLHPETESTPIGSETSTTPPSSPVNQISVLLLGIDSVSRLNFHRQMPQTATVLADQMLAVELLGYNKLEDNTFPNVIPMISGLESDELKASCLQFKNSTFNDCNFIFDLYKEQGYTTVYAEDSTSLGLFNFAQPGWREQGTDFRLRPVMLEMTAHVGSSHNYNAFMCLGSQRPVDILIEYMAKFLAFVQQSPYFGIFWTSTYTHDYWNYPQLVDADFAAFLQTVDRRNSFVMLVSDHGIRWGGFRNTYQGMMEERQPFLFLVPPPWFAEQYPEAYLNLLTNRHRLTSHFDLYETMRDLLEPAVALSSEAVDRRSVELRAMDPMPRGISLFLEIPGERTCAQAGISPHWCTCHEKQSIQTTNPRVQRAARHIVKHINRLVKPFARCQTLSLHSIVDATLGASNVKVVGKTDKAKHFADITVRLRTKPGMAEFEATVRMHNSGELNLTATISRTNQYGSQSECVNDVHMKLYCFCDSFL